MPTKEQIEQIIKALQKILRIQDWDISFKYVPEAEARDLYGENCSGGNLRYRDRAESQIIINADNSRIKNIPDYWYHTLVHEIYHIVTDDFIYIIDDIMPHVRDEYVRKELNETKNIKYEHLVNRLAQGFVNAYPVSNFDHILKPVKPCTTAEMVEMVSGMTPIMKGV
ncbi:MAG: hypothetical protein WC365_10115 [Candidatus Babeliales bacterium]|jgi:hypothetical protein